MEVSRKTRSSYLVQEPAILIFGVFVSIGTSFRKQCCVRYVALCKRRAGTERTPDTCHLDPDAFQSLPGHVQGRRRGLLKDRGTST